MRTSVLRERDKIPARPIVTTVRRRQPSDCLVAALAMLLDVDYAIALGALEAVDGAGSPAGNRYSMAGAVAAASALGYRARLIRSGRYDPFTSAGVVSVFTADWGHALFVWNGIALDSDGPNWKLWKLADYVASQPTDIEFGDLLTCDRCDDRG